MKKNLLQYLFCLLSIASFAQIKKGTLLLGGNVGASTEKNTNTFPAGSGNKITDFFIAPTVGKAIKENTTAEFSLNFSYGKNQPATGNFTNKIFGTGFSAGIRKYKPVSKSFLLYGQPSIGFNYTKNEGKTTGGAQVFSNSEKLFATSVNLQAGISYFINSKCLLELGLGNLVSISYTTLKSENNNGSQILTNKGNRFSINSSSFLNNLGNTWLGFRFLFNNK